MTRERHRMHANPFSVRNEVERLDPTGVFGRKAPLALDVGCGPGAFTVELAKAHPEWNVLGIEIRQHFVDSVLKGARENQLKNLHGILANVNLRTEELLPDDSVVFVSVNFPDPWFKKRHHKRRVFQEPWLKALAPKLTDGAELHLMTDFEPIGVEALELVDRLPEFEHLGSRDLGQPSTTGIASEREDTHLGRGDPIYRVAARYRR